MKYPWTLALSLLLAGPLVATTPFQDEASASIELDCAAWMAPVGSWGLPMDWMEGACDAVDLRYHAEEEWGLALLWQPEVGERPVLSLLVSVYSLGEAPRPLAELTVDATEHLFHGLLMVGLEKMARDGETDSDRLSTRAGQLLLSVPSEYRDAAYREALASFGSHLLSIRLLIEAKQRQRLTLGTSLCRQVQESGPLFRLWDAAFGISYFPAEYWIRDPEEGESSRPSLTPRISAEVLAPEDKKWMVDRVFGGAFVGESRADFEALYCPEIDSGP